MGLSTRKPRCVYLYRHLRTAEARTAEAQREGVSGERQRRWERAEQCVLRANVVSLDPSEVAYGHWRDGYDVEASLMRIDFVEEGRGCDKAIESGE